MFKNQLKTVLLLGALSALLIFLGRAISPGAMWLFAGLAVAMNFASYFWSDKIVLAMNRARPLQPGEDPALEGIVARLVQRAELPMPKVYVVEDAAPNAFATGRNPEHAVIAVTTGIRRLLTDRELEGVIAHELSHVRNRDILIASIAAMIASVISYLAMALQWGAMFGGARRDDREGSGNIIGALALAIVAPIAATVIQLAISRAREYQADASGAQLNGDPLALASALAKLQHVNDRVPTRTAPATQSLFIVAPFRGSTVARWFSTHPPLEERIRRLEEMAQSTVARPQPPRGHFAV